MPELSPYFASLARRPRMCPECHGRLGLQALERTWDGAMWRCGRCGWCQLEQAPEAARMGQREPEGKGANIIRVDFGK